MNIAQNRIISLARSGDKRACEMLIDLIYPTVEPIARKNLPPGEEKQDLLQEIFHILMMKWMYGNPMLFYIGILHIYVRWI